MTRCRNCGAHVTERFARVFGNNGNQVHACLDCSVNTDLYEGGGLARDRSSSETESGWEP
jgi:uncharacterized protein YcgI (DUF1989 family)